MGTAAATHGPGASGCSRARGQCTTDDASAGLHGSTGARRWWAERTDISTDVPTGAGRPNDACSEAAGAKHNAASPGAAAHGFQSAKHDSTASPHGASPHDAAGGSAGAARPPDGWA